MRPPAMTKGSGGRSRHGFAQQSYRMRAQRNRIRSKGTDLRCILLAPCGQVAYLPARTFNLVVNRRCFTVNYCDIDGCDGPPQWRR